MCSSVPFAPTSLVSTDSPGRFYLLFLPQGSAVPEKTRILYGTLNVYSKTKINFAREKKLFLQIQKRAAKFCLPSCNLSVGTNALVSPGEKVEFSELGKYSCSHIKNHKLQNTWWLSLFLELQKCLFLEKTPFMKNTSQQQLLALLSLSKFLCDHFLILLTLYNEDMVGSSWENLDTEFWFFQQINFVFFFF